MKSISLKRIRNTRVQVRVEDNGNIRIIQIGLYDEPQGHVMREYFGKYYCATQIYSTPETFANIVMMWIAKCDLETYKKMHDEFSKEGIMQFGFKLDTYNK